MSGRKPFCCIMAICALTASWAQDMDDVVPEQAAQLEVAQADRLPSSQFNGRWRLQKPLAGARDLRLYQRLEGRAFRSSFFLLTEKDPGEVAWNDFTALYATHTRPDSSLQIALGDLRPGFAQGLVLARAPARGGVPALSRRRDSPRLGHRSSGEFPTLRGLALRWNSAGGTAILLAGRNRLDARLDTLGRAVSLPRSGLHISAGQRAARHRLRAWIGGARWRLRRPPVHLGATIVATRFDRPVDLRRPERTPWALHGRGQLQWGLDLRTSWGVAEISGDHQGHGALLAAIRARMGPNRLESLLRYYAPGFHSLYGGAPSAAGMHNELGYLLALAGGGGGLTWRLFADLYRRLRPDRLRPAPGLTQTSGISLGQAWGRGGRLQLSYQARQSPLWQSQGPDAQQSRRLRFDLNWRHGSLQMRLRLEGRTIHTSLPPQEVGLLASARATYRSHRSQIALHLSRYRTDSYQSRIYEFEHSLPGTVSVRSFHGTGWRFNAAGNRHLGPWTISLHYRYQEGPYFGLQMDWETRP